MHVNHTEFFNNVLRWPREINALQLQKTHANRKSTSKSRKHLHQCDRRCWKWSQHKQIKKHCKCSQHNQIKNFICSAFLYLVVLWAFAVCFFIWLCCEYLQRVCCQIDEVVFLICRCFFFIFAVRFFIWLCCKHLQHVCCQIDEVVFLIAGVFFLFAACWALSDTIMYQAQAATVLIFIFKGGWIMLRNTAGFAGLSHQL